MSITIIAAVGKNGELGKDNKLLCHIPEDMSFFKENTINKPIVMGINTLKSLPHLLPEREHLVLTHQNIDPSLGVRVFHRMEDLLFYVKSLDSEVMVIGGAQIYSQMLEYADKMILTKINKDFDADVFFPSFDEDDWTINTLGEYEYEGLGYKRIVYKRKY